jgi:hypothetical protein
MKTSSSAEEEARRRVPHEPPFLRGLAFVRYSAVDLARPRLGIAVAGQRRRIRTELRRLYTGRDICPATPSIRHDPDHG